MSPRRVLDLFCGAGGAAMGYHLAWPDAEIVGIDIVDQPRYPFRFLKADAMKVLENTVYLRSFDFIHASPPCQAYSITKHSHGKEHPELLTPVMERLLVLDIPFVVENVPGAPYPNPVELCGAAFNLVADDIDGVPLVLRRHRLFWSNNLIIAPSCECAHYRRAGVRVGGVYGAGPSNRAIGNRTLGRFRGGYTPTQPVRKALMGIDWMTQAELSQAVPPVYTRFIAEQFSNATVVGVV